MERPPKWYPLPTFPDLPELLVSAHFTQSSYTLYVTDLANIWVEKLDRKAVLLRSLQENTSIDLSDGDPEQWAVFMSKLQAAFDPTMPDHHLTSISIAAAQDSRNRDGLHLRVTCELPQPLDALKWPVRLVKCPPASLASELVLPLIQAHYVRSCETEDLKDQLRAKDAVIAKLLDKLDAMQVPLEQIFNALSAKHATTRAAAEDKIKGLAPFDEGEWRRQRTIPSPEDASALLHSVFGGSGFTRNTAMEFGVFGTLSNWWQNIGSGFHAPRSENKDSRRQVKENTVTSSSPGEADDEDFQVQTTPPRLPSRPAKNDTPTRSKANYGAKDSDDSDVSDSRSLQSKQKPRSKIGTLRSRQRLTDDNPTSQSSRTLQTDEDDTASDSEGEEEDMPPQNAKHSSNLLGKIGKFGKSSPPKKKDTLPPVSRMDTNDDTASGSDSGDEKPSILTSSPKEPPATPRRGGLGRIGGRLKVTPSPAKSPLKPASNTEPEDSASLNKPDTRKIGAIGRSNRTDAKRVHSDPSAEPEESETEEQKAERKRAELAKELSSKANAPTRKKRKF
jgi:hypothetical protein